MPAERLATGKERHRSWSPHRVPGHRFCPHVTPRHPLINIHAQYRRHVSVVRPLNNGAVHLIEVLRAGSVCHPHGDDLCFTTADPTGRNAQ